MKGAHAEIHRSGGEHRERDEIRFQSRPL
jgi:hypothetical protein